MRRADRTGAAAVVVVGLAGTCAAMDPVAARTVASQSESVIWSDMDGDGEPDLVLTSFVYLNQGGEFVRGPGVGGSDVAVADLDGDGDNDVVAAGFYGYHQALRNGGGALTRFWETDPAIVCCTDGVSLGDWDLDGDPDIAMARRRARTEVYRNLGGQGFRLDWSPAETGEGSDVLWGDYDRDGDADLAVLGISPPARIYRNDAGALTLAATFGSTRGWQLAWVDFDRDGDLDLSVATPWDGQCSRLFRNEDGVFADVWSDLECGRAMAWADFDGDGDMDVAVADAGPGSTGPHPTRVYENDGGIFRLAFTSIDNLRADDVAWGDWDGDGDPDLAVAGLDGVRVYRNGGRGVCGDGVVNIGEQCDDRNTAPGDGCRGDCTLEICGDGHLDPREFCDDGNRVNGDGCSSACNLEVCGNGTIELDEACDDGNAEIGDGCRPDCTRELCGDGRLDPFEACDDGNTLPGDGCRADCRGNPCCLAGSCTDLEPVDCLARGGVSGFCNAGQACGGAACNGTAIAPIRGLKAVKYWLGRDVKLTWAPDPNADLYVPWLVYRAQDLPAAGPGGTGAPLPRVTPSTVASAVHEDALPGTARPLVFYQVTGVCGAAAPAGACCDAIGTCLGEVPAIVCASLDVRYAGDASTCASLPCEPWGACCGAGGSPFTCGPHTRAECTASGGTYRGDGSSCTCRGRGDPGANCGGLRPQGACRDLTTGACLGVMTEEDCERCFGGRYDGHGTTC